MKKQEEIFLLLVRDAIRLGKPSKETEEKAQDLSEEMLDGILDLAKLHHLGPIAGQMLYTLRGDWPRAAGLRQSVLMTGAETARKSVALQRLAGALEHADVAYCVVKGAVCRTLYPNPDLRISMDEDILAEDLAKAERIFAELGYRQLPVGQENGPVHTWMGESGLKVELHRELVEDFDLRPAGGEPLKDGLAQRVRVQTAYGPLYTLAPQTHFLYLLLHFYKHFLTGGVGLRQLCDLVLFAERFGDSFNWREIWRFLAAERLDVLFYNLLDIGVRYLGAEPGIGRPPAGMDPADSGDLLADILAAGAYGSSTLERKRSSRMTLAAARRGSAGKGNFLRAAFPRRSELAGQYPYLEKRPWLLPVAWGSRIFTYVRSGGSRGAAASVEIGSARVALLQKYKIVDR